MPPYLPAVSDVVAIYLRGSREHPSIQVVKALHQAVTSEPDGTWSGSMRELAARANADHTTVLKVVRRLRRLGVLRTSGGTGRSALRYEFVPPGGEGPGRAAAPPGRADGSEAMEGGGRGEPTDH